MNLSLFDDLGDDFQRVGRPEHLLEVVLGGAVAAGGVLEHVFGGDDLFEVAVELAALYRERRVRVDEHLEPRAVRFQAGRDCLVE
ncbi:hypothetical protein D320_16869 [Haloferax sp. BAB-2207]|nr:hypothetical protein D320_16869 [Haloferax sp. BAB-2207]